MAHSDPNDKPSVAPADAPDTTPTRTPTHTIRHDGWTADKQIGFLKALATTQNVRAAARSVGMGRQSAYKLRTRLDDAPFGAAWRLATRHGHSALLEAALARAINGVEIPHYWQGELIGTSRRYDERLTALLLTSGLLDRASARRDSAESEFAQSGLTRLLDRIAQGPAHWRDFGEERKFAWADDPDQGEPNEDDPSEDEPGEEQASEGENAWAKPPDETAPAGKPLSLPAPDAELESEPEYKPSKAQGSGPSVRAL